MPRILKIDKLRSNLLRSILKSDNWQKKIPSKEEFQKLDVEQRAKMFKQARDLRSQEHKCLYKYVGELERTHPHFMKK